MKRYFRVLTLIIVFSFISCNRYYSPVLEEYPQLETIKKYITERRHFVLRDSSFVYDVRNISLNEEKNQVICDVEPLSGLRISKDKSSKQKNYYYRPARPDSVIRNEVHLYIARVFTSANDTQIVIPVSSIYQIEELKFNRKKTTNNKIAVGLTSAVVVGIIGLVILFNQMDDAEYGLW